MSHTLHDDEIPIDIDLVRTLVDGQFPQYAGLPIARLGASGSTNALFRLGDDLLIRLPRQPGGTAAIDKEHHWLPVVRHQLPIDVPEIVAVGEPDASFGERWSIVRWLAGQLPKSCNPGEPATVERSALARDLADFILALRAVDVPEAAINDPRLRSYRGRPLTEFDKSTQRTIHHCRSISGLDLDFDAALALWTDAQSLPGASEAGPDRWYHSDLVAENLLLTDGRLSSVLDFGGLSVGDPTIDLHGAWEILDTPARAVFKHRLGVDDAEWLRGRAWALAIALGAFSYYWKTMPGRCADRLAMARSVLADVAC